MKRFLLYVISLCIVATSTYAAGGKQLPPEEITIGYHQPDKPVYEPIEVVRLAFASHISIAQGAQALITHNGEVVAQGALSAESYREQGVAMISFDQVVLPKGQAYKVEIPAGTIYLTADPSVMTDRIEIPFAIPEYISGATPSINEGDTVASATSIGFYYKTEVEPIGSPKMMLYREGVLVDTLDARAYWDWDLGQVFTHFESDRTFESGVHYTLVLPEGSVSPRFRTDITNEEAQVHFVGGYTDPPVAPDDVSFVWCSLLDSCYVEELHEVYFYYDRAIKLSENPQVELYNSEYEPIKAVTPTIAREQNRWVLVCDFGGVNLLETGVVCISIPAGTVLAADDSEVTNRTNSLSFNAPRTVDKVADMEPSVRSADSRIIVENAPLGSLLTIYTIDGKAIMQQPITTQPYIIGLKASGHYIVLIGDRAYRVSL